MLLVLVGMARLAFAWHRRELERRLEVERVRARIAADLHDDLGANLTRVVILSEVAQRQTNSSNGEVGQRLTEIADTARGLTDSLGDLVWSINPLRDDVPSLLNRVREFASDVLESQGIRWSLTTSESIHSMPLMPEQRWQLFLIVKEAINNAARHSGCTSVALHLQVADGWATVRITDDGCGLPRRYPANETGNGLANMRKRATALAGELAVRSEPGAGVTVELRFPLESTLRVK
jgi:signal transduction histidine kinase